MARHRRQGPGGPQPGTAPGRSWPGGARCAVALSFDSDHETIELRNGGKSLGKISQGQYGGRRRFAAHPRLPGPPRGARLVLHAGRRRHAAPRRAATRDRGRPRAGDPQLDPRAQRTAGLRRRARPDLPGGRRAGEAVRRASRRHAHGLLGLQPPHAAHRARDGAPLRQLADGRRRALRARRGGSGNRRRRAAGRVDPRRCGLLQHGPGLVAAALHEPRRGALHLHARVRGGLSREGAVPAHHCILTTAAIARASSSWRRSSASPRPRATCGSPRMPTLPAIAPKRPA